MTQSWLRRFGAVARVAGVAIVLGATAWMPLAAQQSVAADQPREAHASDVFARPVTVQLDRVSFKVALQTIATAAGIRVQYRNAILDAMHAPITLHAAKMPLGKVFEQLLNGTQLAAVPVQGDIVSIQPLESVDARLLGGISGRVIDAAKKNPVAGASVTLEGTKYGTRTADDGTFRISGVLSGTYRVSVRRLGYRVASTAVVVKDDSTASLTIALVTTTTTLDEIVTTATGERRRLEVGNAVGTIQADSIVPTTLIRNMSDLLQARIPGMFVSNTDGSVGAPSKIRIRGVNSVSLNNDPIVIIDGVRMNAQTTVADNQTNVGSASTLLSNPYSGYRTRAPSRLDDIDPNTIESIDVLRGPSASSLYGTDAANGVIVIKTKRGRAGDWRINLSGDDGWSTIPGTFPESWFGLGVDNLGNATSACVLALGSDATVVGGGCRQDSVGHFNQQNDPDLRTLGTGTAKTLAGNISGGSDQLQQFLSARASSSVGLAKMSSANQRLIANLWNTPAPSWMIRPNTEQDYDGSSQTTFRISPTSDVALSASGMYRNVLDAGGGAGSDPGLPMLGAKDTLGGLAPDALRQKSTSVAKHAIVAATANYNPLTWLGFNATSGGDYTLRTDQLDARAEDCTPILAQFEGCGSTHANARGETFVTTVNGRAQLSYAPLSWLHLQTSIGENYSHTSFYSLQAGNGDSYLAFGSTLLSPTPVISIPDCASCQLYQVVESRDEAATAGWWLEQSVNVLGMYSTFGVRHDVASAFGAVTKQTPPSYPKLNLSYPVSEQTFFPKQSLVSSLRLRMAYGQSGNQASQSGVLNDYSQFQYTYPNAPSLGTVTTNYLTRIGNPLLKPERTTEWEGGFDASFLNNERIRVVFTAFRKYSKDDIVSITLPPSYGVQSLSENYNLGNVDNRGVELSVDARLLDTRAIGWDLTLNFTQTRNKLVHLAPSFPANGPNGTTFHEGYPLFGYWGYPVVSYADLNHDGILDRSELTLGPLTFMGAPYPKHEITYVNSISLLNGALHVNASFDQITGLANALAVGSGAFLPRGAVDPTASLAEQAGYIEAFLNPQQSYISETSSVRFNELSATYNVPAAWARRVLRVQSLALTLAGRNLALWTNYAGKDPNVDGSDFGLGDATLDLGSSVPQPRNWTLRFNLGL